MYKFLQWEEQSMRYIKVRPIKERASAVDMLGHRNYYPRATAYYCVVRGHVTQ